MCLEEPRVVEAIRNWIRSEHQDWIIWRKWHFDVIAGPSKSQPSIVVECKGGASQRFKVHRTIGQCLDYTEGWELANVPCYIAIPKDFIYNDRVLRILEFHQLPMGLLNVDDEGKVSILREARPRTRQVAR